LFTFKHHLQLHVQRIHSDVKSYKCSVCPKSFATSYNLNLHGRVHTVEKPYACPQCLRSFATYKTLKSSANSYKSERLQMFSVYKDLCHSKPP
jgi:KRAB domain-containing zinc finger protein